MWTMKRFISAFIIVLFLIAAPITVLAEADWQFCANENGFCKVRGKAEVRYGIEGRYVYKIVVNGVNCSNDFFGDPAVGAGKTCFYREISHQKRERHGQFCANENGFCKFRGRADIRYGADGRYVHKMLRNGTSCSNDVFGDPAPGVGKSCYIMD